MKFSELGLKDSILSAITKMGYESPTPIQEKSIPYLLENDGDLIGLASTGTGKTASFGLPLLNQVDTQSKNTQGLVICPTRELCIQISNDLKAYSENIKGLSIVPVYGGTDIGRQIKQIERGAQIVVATPGRLIDLINRKKIKLWEVEAVVLDEADEMLNMGFKEDIDAILDQTPDFKNVWLFSATMPKEVARIAKNYMEDPFEITVGGKNETNKNIEHHYYTVKERDRFQALKSVIDFNPNIYGVIFCRTRRDTAAVADKLMAGGYNAEPIHGDLSQAQRDRVMDKFRSKTLQLLVATDVAARGIDVNDITHVIHYQLPEDVENYTHRSGRTARAGKKGTSIALINTKEGRKIKSIERIINTSFELKKVPTSDQICEKQLLSLIKGIKNDEADTSRIDTFLPVLMEELGEYSKEEIIKRFVATEFNKFLDYYENARDLNATARDNGRDDFGSKKRGRDSRNDPNQQRFFVGLGRKDGFNHGALLRLLCDNTGISKANIGKIDILEKFSFFDADKNETERILESMKGVDFEGNRMSIEKTKGSNDKGDGKRSSSRRSGGRSRRNERSKSSNRRRSYRN
ncbi:DEAD/DEAH box helicase [Crocinitomix algicola]|uniref:DEAD/DEAH box helicase n=1 Tax=Crocinitomix algicola TaxID=1740263 RepID=UPI00082A315B|nr:DEAD/DEAH box helicase [Crocinitomix algicola]